MKTSKHFTLKAHMPWKTDMVHYMCILFLFIGLSILFLVLINTQQVTLKMPARKKIGFSQKVCGLKAATSNKQWNVLTNSCKTPKYDNLLSGSCTITCGETQKHKQHIFRNFPLQKQQERWTNIDHTQCDIPHSSKPQTHKLQQRSSTVCLQASRSFRHPKTFVISFTL